MRYREFLNYIDEYREPNYVRSLSNSLSLSLSLSLSCLLCNPRIALDLASSLSRKLAYVPGPTFGFVKLLASSDSQWADEQHWPAGFESGLVLDLPSLLSPLSSAFRLLTSCQVVSGGRQRQINGMKPVVADKLPCYQIYIYIYINLYTFINYHI